MARSPIPALDRSLPAALIRIGRYPLHHGGVGVIRSLGRAGVPVYAITESRSTPAAVSRYLTGRHVWPTSGAERPEELLAGLRALGARIGRPAVAVATDDEAAALLAEHREELAEFFLLPPVDPKLPMLLADKQALFDLCVQHGVPTPLTETVESAEQLNAAVGRLGTPVVVKNLGPWDRLVAPVVSGTTTLYDEAAVAAVARTLEAASGPAGRRVLVQEYLAPEEGESPRAPDWFTHVYCPADGGEPLVFTGVKLQAWPPAGGVTARGLAVPNAELARRAGDFCRSIGYRGVGDVDWRFDPRDGELKLVDFNPRLGAQAQVFRTPAGLDLVRALHLDLSGRPLPPGGQIDGRELIVEHLAAAAGLLRRIGRLPRRKRPAPARREPAWFAWDDPLPFAASTAGFAAEAVGKFVLKR